MTHRLFLSVLKWIHTEQTFLKPWWWLVFILWTSWYKEESIPKCQCLPFSAVLIILHLPPSKWVIHIKQFLLFELIVKSTSLQRRFSLRHLARRLRNLVCGDVRQVEEKRGTSRIFSREYKILFVAIP